MPKEIAERGLQIVLKHSSRCKLLPRFSEYGKITIVPVRSAETTLDFEVSDGFSVHYRTEACQIRTYSFKERLGFTRLSHMKGWPFYLIP
jgi:hypothetical protein